MSDGRTESRRHSPVRYRAAPMTTFIRFFAQLRAWGLLGLLLVACACTSQQQYRTDYRPCDVTEDERCADHALQSIASRSGPKLTLGFIEFDDQGQLWDFHQKEQVEQEIRRLASDNDLLLITYVHGWKHDARVDDDDVKKFRGLMLRVVNAESAYASSHGERPRKVVGVYLGWRGESTPVPGLKELTFWSRKNTAEEVGHGSVTEVLNELEVIKRTRNAMCDGCDRTKLVVIGHSFGAAVVFNALSQTLLGRFIRSDAGCPFASSAEDAECRCPPNASCDVGGFGNLVVLLNPAFQALDFASLSDVSAARGSYFDSQLPLLVVLTSEADWATRYAFKVGRSFSTMLESHRTMRRWNGFTRQEEEIAQGTADRTAIGHFEPYRTHVLVPTSSTEKKSPVKQADYPVQETPAQTERALEVYSEVSSEWVDDQPGGSIHFDRSTLTRNSTSAGQNPYLVAYVDGELIRDHGDVFNENIVEFIEQIVLISTQTPQQLDATMSRSQSKK